VARQKELDFEKRCADAMETIASAMVTISKSTEGIEASQKQLNDNFLLHQAKSESDHLALKEEAHGIRQDLKETMYPIFKWLVIAVIAIAGGTAVVRLLGV